jgi:3'-phosphoadenosine 5'-phosphosulfate sulfotransferase (PAPS reductase)/FAD synthetase
MSRIVSWYSCGAASAVATKIAIKDHGEVVPAYCETGAEHPDNKRFMADCEEWFGTKVTSIRSEEYPDTWSVWQKRSYMSGLWGAPCTSELKIGPRLEFQKPDDVHIFGYTADSSDVARAVRLRANYPELTIETPLIRDGLTKEACLAMIDRAGIKVPVMYGLGFQNNNCIPCVKATSPAYWALVRKEFPEEFERAAKLSREIGCRMARYKGERIFIDEVPADHPTTNAISPSCDFLCHIAEQDLEGE